MLVTDWFVKRTVLVSQTLVVHTSPILAAATIALAIVFTKQTDVLVMITYRCVQWTVIIFQTFIWDTCAILAMSIIALAVLLTVGADVIVANWLLMRTVIILLTFLL